MIIHVTIVVWQTLFYHTLLTIILFEGELATVVILERKYFKHQLPLACRNNTQP